MKITFDTAGKGFFALLGRAIIRRIDPSLDDDGAGLLASLVGSLGPTPVGQEILGRLAHVFNLADGAAPAPEGKPAPYDMKSWERLAEILIEREAFRPDAGSLATMAADYIEKIDPKKVDDSAKAAS